MGVIFEGEGPFELPPAQSATARAEDGFVEIRFEMLLGSGHPTFPVPVRVRLPYPKALELAAQLQPALRMAEVQRRRR
jgi:hypothetical protein